MHSLQRQHGGDFSTSFAASGEFIEAERVSAVRVQVVAPSLVSWGLQRLIQSSAAPLRLMGASATLAEAMPLMERSAADVVLLDLDDGYDAAVVADASQRLGCKVVVLTCLTDDALRARLFAAGAREVFYKHQSPAQLLQALERAGRGEPAATATVQFAPATPVARVQSSPAAGRLSELTAKERQTVAAVVADPSSPAKVIAARLFISEHTLRNHLTSIYSKLEVNGRLGLQALVGHVPSHRGPPC